MPAYTCNEQICEGCKIRELRERGPILPTIGRSDLCFLTDFAFEEDAVHGRVLTGTNSRTEYVYSLISSAKVNPESVTLTSAIKCITRSKGIIQLPDYELCFNHVRREIEILGIKYILAFGAMATQLLTGKKVLKIEDSRGVLVPTLIPDVFVVPTFSLYFLADGNGCSSCGKNIYRNLARKDLETLLSYARKDKEKNKEK